MLKSTTALASVLIAMALLGLLAIAVRLAGIVGAVEGLWFGDAFMDISVLVRSELSSAASKIGLLSAGIALLRRSQRASVAALGGMSLSSADSAYQALFAFLPISWGLSGPDLARISMGFAVPFFFSSIGYIFVLVYLSHPRVREELHVKRGREQPLPAVVLS